VVLVQEFADAGDLFTLLHRWVTCKGGASHHATGFSLMMGCALLWFPKQNAIVAVLVGVLFPILVRVGGGGRLTSFRGTQRTSNSILHQSVYCTAVCT
jgi:hypothetical protein